MRNIFRYKETISKMIIPIRCFTCGKVVANLWKLYTSLKAKGMSSEEIFKKLKVRRYCCKRMFIANVDLMDKIIQHTVKENVIVKIN